jgi:hypothetical protein
MQDMALIIVEAEDGDAKSGDEAEGPGGFLKEELLLSARVEKEDIYARQQGEWSYPPELSLLGAMTLVLGVDLKLEPGHGREVELAAGRVCIGMG